MGFSIFGNFIPFPTTVYIFLFGDGIIPNLFKYIIPGNLSLFNNNLKFSKKSEHLKILFSRKINTGYKVQPYFKAYFMKPFRFFRIIR